MAKRVSVKGRGAEIFFGDHPTPQISEGSDLNATASSESEDDRITESNKKARMQESKNARKKYSLPQNQHPANPLTDNLLSSIWQNVSERATITNSFRYTDQELSRLSDALYEISKRHGIKITKQEIARLGLNAILWDYQERGDSSLLSEFAMKKGL